MRMSFFLPLSLVFSLISVNIWADGRVRHVTAEKDQIVTVRTSLGIATIIQVPDKPNSVVVGDMSAFKVEYLDTAITIKPLSTHAKSNLYIYTDYKRFSVQLVPASESQADYIVYLDNPKIRAKPRTEKLAEGIKWHHVQKSMSNAELSMRTTRMGMRSDGLILLEFELYSTKPEDIRPEWFWLTQNGETKPIQGLVLSSLKIGPKSPVTGMIEIMKTDLNGNDPLRVELRKKKTSYLSFQGVTNEVSKEHPL
jgi:hypothetical protein